MNYIKEAFHELSLQESKEDQQRFIDKFGQDVFNQFNKAKQRLKNNNISTDILWHVKNTGVDEMKKILLSLYDDKKDAQKKRVIAGTDKDIRGKYNYLGEHGGYKIYEPLDYLASMDLGVNTGWCTTGRYTHAGHPEYTPSEKDAKAHFNMYTAGNNENYNARLFYFLNPETMYGEYAVAAWDKTWPVNFMVQDGDRHFYIKSSNIKIYNSKDELDYAAKDKLPLDVLPIDIEMDVEEITPPNVEATETYIYDGEKINLDQTAKDLIRKVVLSEDYDTKVRMAVNGQVIEDVGIPHHAFRGLHYLQEIYLPESIVNIGSHAFYDCLYVKIKTPQHSIRCFSHDREFLINHMEYTN